VEGYAGIMVRHTQDMLKEEWRPGARPLGTLSAPALPESMAGIR
jgi:hypothetical protein